MKYLIAVLMMAFILAPQKIAQANSSSLQEIQTRTALIRSKCDAGSGWGTGVYIADGKVYTAAHVVDGTNCSITIDGVPTEVLWIDTERDIATLSTRKKSGQ